MDTTGMLCKSIMIAGIEEEDNLSDLSVLSYQWQYNKHMMQNNIAR